MSVTPTPGPWQLNTQYADIEVRGPDGSGVLIAVMCPWGIAADGPSPQAANARLIAAAPDLYDAADNALNVLIGCCVPAGGVDDRKAILDAQAMLRAAIAKATGEKA